MMEPGSFGTFDAGPGSVPPPPVVPMVQLRPLTTGEILDRTFSLYRRRFWLFCGISAVSASLVGILQITEHMFMGPGSFMTRITGVAPNAIPSQTEITGIVGTLIAFPLWLVAFAITQGATVSAASTLYLGHDTSFGKVMRVGARKWWRYLLILLWRGWSMLWAFGALLIPAVILLSTKVDALIVVGIILALLSLLAAVYGIIAYIRNTLAIPASVFEGLSLRKSMRRSKTLSKGRWWGIFLLGLLMYALSLVAAGLQFPFAMMMALFATKPGLHLMSEALTVLVTFVTQGLVAPVGWIALTLFYIDQRVRQEGFDLEAMMDPTIGSGFVPSRIVAPPPPPAVLPGGFAPSGFTAPGFNAEPVPFAPSGFAAEPPPSPPASPFAPSGFAGGAEPAGDGS